MSSQVYTDGVTLSAAAEFNKFDTVAYSVLSGVAGTNTITATGPANYSYAATTPPVTFIPAATNTGATTINITPSGSSALGAKNVFFDGAACVGGELVIGVPVSVIYDGTQFNILSGGGLAGTSASTYTFDGSGGTSGSITRTYRKVGKMVVLDLPATLATSGTSSTKLAADTALPTTIRPTAAHQFITQIYSNNAGLQQVGMIDITAAGIVNIYKAPNTTDAFANTTANCGLGEATTVIYFTG